MRALHLKNLLLLGLTLFTLQGCKLNKQVLPVQSSVKISNGLNFKLLSPQSLNKTVNLNQLLQASFNGQKQKLNLMTQITPQEIKVTGLTTLGNRLFDLKYDGKYTGIEISSVTRLMAKTKGAKLNTLPQFMLADMQLTYWPLDEIRRILPANAAIQELDNGDGFKRILYENNKPIVEINFSQKNPWISKIYYQHLERHYQYVIENIEE